MNTVLKFNCTFERINYIACDLNLSKALMFKRKKYSTF